MTVVLAGRSRGGVPLKDIVLEIVPAALAVLLLAAVGIMHVASRVMVVRMGYELSRLDSERTTLQREQDRLKVELATIKSPARLENAARHQLGLGPAAAGEVIHLRAP